MRWLLEFYNERRAIFARYDIEAALPAAAAASGLSAALADYPSPRKRGRPRLFEQAERIGGQDASGWVLHRIVKAGAPGSPEAVAAPAT